jgi:hypothetical protein
MSELYYTNNIGSKKSFTWGYNDCSFAFEFVPMDVNASFDVSVAFDAFTDYPGFSPVEAVTTIDVPYTNQFDSLFYFDSDDTNVSQAMLDGSLVDASYGILGTSVTYPGINPFTIPNIEGIQYSDSKVTKGWANPSSDYTDNTSLKQDYIRYTAKSITGGYALEDVFQNEQELLAGVETMNALFTNKLREKVEDIKNCQNDPASAGYLTCQSLVTGLLQSAISADTTSSRYKRGVVFLDDLSAQSQETNDPPTGLKTRRFFVKFHPGDVIAFRFTYKPKYGNNAVSRTAPGDLIGENKLFDRTYKVYLKFVAPVV